MLTLKRITHLLLYGVLFASISFVVGLIQNQRTFDHTAIGPTPVEAGYHAGGDGDACDGGDGGDCDGS